VFNSPKASWARQARGPRLCRQLYGLDMPSLPRSDLPSLAVPKLRPNTGNLNVWTIDMVLLTYVYVST
jgi:hypothetical protein